MSADFSNAPADYRIRNVELSQKLLKKVKILYALQTVHDPAGLNVEILLVLRIGFLSEYYDF